MTITHTDGLPEDRVLCGGCRHCDPGSYRCTKLKTSVLLDIPLRCVLYLPNPAERDQRPGSARWPGMKEAIADARAKDLEAQR